MKCKSKKTLVLMIIMCLVAALALTGCGGGDSDDSEAKDKENKPVEYVSPLTGAVSDEAYPARPVVVSIDNVGDAIPQSWISKADMVYEFIVEGGQTRLQAVFHSEFPDAFGPVRSTRPYFVDLAREYKAVFVAHGWSPDAKKYLQSDVVPYVNAMNSSADFYRVDDKAAPHNSYVKWSEIKNQIDTNGWWDEEQEIRPFAFLGEDETATGESAVYVSVDYPISDSEYTYDAATGLYTRTVDGAPYVDKETGESITVSNVLIQRVSSEVLDQKGRLEIDMCAGGEAMLFTDGVVVKGTWSRSDLDSRTVFVDTEGNEFKLSPGTTWVQVADQQCSITYEAAAE